MIELRPFEGIGRFRNDWLNAHHHFSFGQYHDRGRMGWGSLRVWNDDEIAPSAGFDPHPHRDMEIITFIRQGAITHRDNLGNEGVTRAGDVQVMHAGTGIVHAEYNREAEPTRLFQIWIVPDRTGVEPGWASREFPRMAGSGLQVLAGGRPGDAELGALPLYADAAVLAARLAPGERATYDMAPGRAAYLVAATGSISVRNADASSRDGVDASSRDGVAVSGERAIVIEAGAEETELVLVDVRG
ncbi:pirin family protein [Acidiphilium sp. AL]|uniref:Pirin family protein n=1 Tax=Acidiphilium iwatense TaxID=768198 RepID=A0ABS9DYS7_9PROT|nr:MULTISPECIES: pirin family protein [Acidiphilium]MCF3947848.1 pirin family protein [Acidiphilium iwatense]MCU4160057.1 pirin family protein [Acidiphilium sp. AL]